MEFNEDKVLAHYRELCKKRDAIYKLNEPLEKLLDASNARMEEHRKESERIAKLIDQNFLGANWFPLKKEIRFLAKALGKKDGPLATKE